MSLCEPQERSASLENLRAYFRDDAGRPAYSGSRFEFFGDNPPYRIVLDDLVAVSMLSVDVPAHAVLRILERDAGAITALLLRIPADRDLHEAEEKLVDHDSPAEKLWAVLRDGSGDRPRRVGMGEVRLSKILARKRPRLLPVYDRYVGRALGLGNSNDHWLALHRRFAAQPELVAGLRGLATEAGVPPGVSVLRVLDVLLWMRGRHSEDA